VAYPSPRSPSWQPSVPPFAVRAARLTDLAALSDLLVSSFYEPSFTTQVLTPLLRLGIQEDLRQRLAQPKPNYACLLVTQPIPNAPPTPAGTAELSCRQPWPWQPMDRPYLYISNLAVHPSYRRQGVGQLLLQTCTSTAQQWGFRALYLHVMDDNHPARQLYHRQGFVLVQRETSLVSWLGWQPQRLLLRKGLAPT